MIHYSLVLMRVTANLHLLDLVTQALETINKIAAQQLATVSIIITILCHGHQRKLIQ